jgi:2-oxopent-4-enoate/cis-2-oxohex-4-enoate hydratase
VSRARTCSTRPPGIAPCFEIVDSRIRDWKIRIQDTVADNASCGVFVLGAERVDPRALDLASSHA